MIKSRKIKKKSNPDLKQGNIYRVTDVGTEASDYFDIDEYFTYTAIDSGSIVISLQSDVYNNDYLSYDVFKNFTDIKYVEVVLQEVEEL